MAEPPDDACERRMSAPLFDADADTAEFSFHSRPVGISSDRRNSLASQSSDDEHRAPTMAAPVRVRYAPPPPPPPPPQPYGSTFEYASPYRSYGLPLSHPYTSAPYMPRSSAGATYVASANMHGSSGGGPVGIQPPSMSAGVGIGNSGFSPPPRREGLNRSNDNMESNDANDCGSRANAEGSQRLESNLLRINIERERLMHNLAAQHHLYRSDWWLFLPSIIITMVIGIISFVKDSEIILEKKRVDNYNVVVGCLAIFSTFWQGLTKQLDLSGKARIHKSVAVALKRLTEEMNLSSASAGDDSAQLNAWKERFAQAVDGCDSVIPVNISNAFDTIHTRIDNALGREYRIRLGADSIHFYDAVFDQLSVTICAHWLWPWSVPSPEYLVEKTLRDLGNISRNLRTTSCWEYLYCYCCSKATRHGGDNFEYALRKEILYIASCGHDESNEDDNNNIAGDEKEENSEESNGMEEVP